MSFPYIYAGHLDIIGREINDKPVSKDLVNSILSDFVKDKESNPEKQDSTGFHYIETNTLFKIPYGISLYAVNDESDYQIQYEIEADRLLKIIPAVVVAMAFISFFSINTYLISAAVFVIVFYVVNIFFVSADLLKKLNVAVGNTAYDFGGSEYLSKSQKQWMDDPYLCSACGYPVTDIDLHCPDCGLKLKQNRYSMPLDTSKYQDSEVKYHFKSKS